MLLPGSGFQEVLDKAFTGPGSKHSSGSKMKPEEITPLSEDDHGYEGIPFDDSETKNPSSCQNCLLSGNNYCTIPLSQGHVLSNCKMVVERRTYRFYNLNVNRNSYVW
jgi:hypothetical protein